MEDLVTVRRNEPVCTSLDVAEHFRKRHKYVLEKIEQILKESQPADFSARCFRKAAYIDAKGEARPMYYMNRDGFSVLVMGFTGKEALEWKWKYIAEFNRMEQTIKEHSSAEWVEAREQSKIGRKEATEVYKGFVDYAEASGSRNAKMYYKHFTVLAHNIVGITDRDQASAIQLCQLVQVEQMISLLTSEKTKEGKEYHQVFREVKAEMEEYAKMSRFKEIQNVWNNKRRVEIASRQA